MKKLRFMENVKNPMKAGMLCTIDGKTFHSFAKNTWIGSLSASCHITYDDTSLCDITDINKLVQGSSGNMSAMKKSKLCIRVYKVNGSEKLQVLWLVKYYSKAGANLYFLT